MAKQLMIKPEKCTNCRTCEIFCSFNRSGEVNPKKSAVTVMDYEEALISVPVMCMQCDDASCVKACPMGAISRDSTGTVVINESKCIVCKMCVNACALGNITYNFSSKKVFKCELCGGDPMCVKFCPSGALIFEDPTYGTGRKQLIANSYKEIFKEEV